MPIPLPNLDDRSYAELTAEAQALIPGLCAEWTNHNASDPGIMLMELLAWLTEMTLFQLNEVPPKNIETFLELLGWAKAQDDLDGAIREALLAIRKRYRAVTAADFKRLAREQWPETEAARNLGEAAKIRRVCCVPQRDLAATDPAVRDQPAPAHVSVVVIPDNVDPYLGPPPALRDGYDLRLMSVDTADDLVNEGRNLVIVALVGTDLHIRIFDANGKRVIDKAENELISGETLIALKKQLVSLPDESSLSNEQKQKFILDAASIAGYTLRDALHAFFQERCLLTTRHHIVGPSYITVEIGARLHLRDDAPPERVLNTAVEALYAFFDPLVGGPERTGWPFGRDVYASEIYTLFDEHELVDYVEDVRLSAPGAQGRVQMDGAIAVGVTLDAHELVTVKVTDLVAIDRNGHQYVSEALAVIGYSPLGRPV